MTQEDKKRITTLISTGETGKALETLTELLEGSKTGKDHLSILYNISARYHKLMAEKGRGILFKADEEVLQSRINDDLLRLLDQIEKPVKTKTAAPARKTASPLPKQPEPAPPVQAVKSRSSLPGWLWTVGGVAMIVSSYFIFFDKPVAVAFPKICVLTDLNSQCCPDNYNRIRVQEASRQMVVSVLLNKDLADPYITGIVYDQNRNQVPIRQLSLTLNEGAICYSGLLHRTDNSYWTPGLYTIEFSVNQQPAGSLDFSIIP